MNNYYQNKFKKYFLDIRYLWSFFISILFLCISVMINTFASHYASEVASGSVTDLILSNIPVFDVSTIFIYGPIIFALLIIGVCIFEPKKIPFTLKSIAIFYLIRSIFIVLTHTGSFPTQISIDSTTIMGRLSSGSDMFFSGHTGLPFLMALIYWREKILRFIFIIFSVIFAITVLLGHLHYSIDVLGAYFITYTIYCLAERLFKKDEKPFLGITS